MCASRTQRDDSERKDHKEHMAGEGNHFGAGNNRALHEGMRTVQQCAAGADAECMQSSPSLALREQAYPNEKSQIYGEHEDDGGPVPFP